MASISASEAHDNIEKLWETAAREPVTVLNAGRPIAIVLSPEEYDRMAARRKPRQPGTGKHLLAGVGVNALLAVDVTNIFSEYL